MIDRLLQFILEFWGEMKPFVVIPYYNRGVRLRWGRKCGAPLDHGFHWKLPFADDVLTHMVKTTTMNISEQSVTTKDDHGVVVAAVVKYSVDDVEKLLLEVNSPVDALNDMVKGIIRKKITESDWKDCNTDALETKISKNVKHEARKWGITVEEITLTDLGKMRSVRLMLDVEKMFKNFT